jgi:predicted nucleotide-binding protein (sugar kinase/HSP70/actin superfamily)
MRVGQGNLFGFRAILEQAAVEFARAQNKEKLVPVISLVGEIYVRQDPFSNDFIVPKLMDRGIKVRFAPFTEWLEYSDYFARQEGLNRGVEAQLTTFVQNRILDMTYNTMAKHLDWGKRVTVKDTIKGASPYLRQELVGEEVLTIGGPLHEWHHGGIDGVVSVGPLECMPNKIAEAQYHHIAQKEGLPSLTLSSNGDPVDETLLDNFVFEIKERFAQRLEANKGKRQKRYC